MEKLTEEDLTGILGDDPEQYMKSFVPRDTLAPEIFDETGEMIPEVQVKLMEIAQDFWDSLDPLENVKLVDVVLTGSLAAYSWSAFSDADLHLLLDFDEVEGDDALVEDYMQKAKSLWNATYSPVIEGFDVEVYLQDESEPHVAAGVYSVMDGEWVSEPTKDKPVIDIRDIKVKAETMMAMVDDIVGLVEAEEYDKALEKIHVFKKKLRKMRKTGLDSAGIYSVENLAFKVLRRNGYLAKITKAKIAAYDALMSLGGSSRDPITGEVKESEDVGYEFSSTQVQLPEDLGEMIRAFGEKIPDKDLFTGGSKVDKDSWNGLGREQDFHITLKYGIHTPDVDDVLAVLGGQESPSVVLGKVAVFNNDGFDVVIVEVESPDLHKLNALVSEGLEVTDTYPEYRPHATVAYVQPGRGDQYIGEDVFEGEQFFPDEVVFSSKNGEKSVIPLVKVADDFKQ